MIIEFATSISIDALVFDAYGTLFDVQSVYALAETLAPGRGAAIALFLLPVLVVLAVVMLRISRRAEVV